MRRPHLRAISPALAAATLTSAVLALAQPSQAVSTTDSALGLASNVETSAKHGIQWLDSCDGERPDSKTRCGHLIAPLDYEDHSKGDVKLYFKMLLAEDQANKKGTIFGNPGGPGAGGARYAEFFSAQLGANARKHFDIIGLDPRGLGKSTPRFDCGRSKGPYVPAFPLTDDDVNRTNIANENFQESCVNEGNEIAKHMTTADLARDINLAVDSLGEKSINFMGFSYGTYVGATLNNMFPDKVRTIAAIGALDPVQWATGYYFDGLRTPSFQRVRSADGAAELWAAAINECEKAGPDTCEPAKTIRQDWKTLHEKGRDAEITVGSQKRDYTQITEDLTTKAYTPSAVYTGLKLISSAGKQLRGEAVDRRHIRELKEFINKPNQNRGLGVPLEEATPEKTSGNRWMWGPKRPWSSLGGNKAFAWGAEGMVGVMCSDSMNPVEPEVLIDAQRRNREILPGEGEFRTWQSAACINWPFKPNDVYRGPFNKTSKANMLILTNEFDGATPYKQGALKLREMTPNSKLILVKGGFGHAPYKYKECSRQYLDDYFMTGKTPQDDVVCTPRRGLFDW